MPRLDTTFGRNSCGAQSLSSVGEDPYVKALCVWCWRGTRETSLEPAVSAQSPMPSLVSFPLVSSGIGLLVIVQIVIRRDTA